MPQNGDTFKDHDWFVKNLADKYLIPKLSSTIRTKSMTMIGQKILFHSPPLKNTLNTIVISEPKKLADMKDGGSVFTAISMATRKMRNGIN